MCSVKTRESPNKKWNRIRQESNRKKLGEAFEIVFKRINKKYGPRKYYTGNQLSKDKDHTKIG